METKYVDTISVETVENGDLVMLDGTIVTVVDVEDHGDVIHITHKNEYEDIDTSYVNAGGMVDLFIYFEEDIEI